MKSVEIDILKDVLNEKFWEFNEGGTEHYVCHMHYNSPFETDWGCGNCDGARCSFDDGRTYPIIYKEEPEIRFTPTSDDLCEILKKYVPSEVAEEFAYSDTTGSYYTYDNISYHFNWPHEYSEDPEVLKFFETIKTKDEELIKKIMEYKHHHPDAFSWDIQKEFISGVNKYDTEEAHHVNNQMKLFL